ncbi:MAG: hypothetical protein AAFU03_19010, partial [Bacteroidota bacterium]
MMQRMETGTTGDTSGSATEATSPDDPVSKWVKEQDVDLKTDALQRYRELLVELNAYGSAREAIAKKYLDNGTVTMKLLSSLVPFVDAGPTRKFLERFITSREGVTRKDNSVAKVRKGKQKSPVPAKEASRDSLSLTHIEDELRIQKKPITKALLREVRAKILELFSIFNTSPHSKSTSKPMDLLWKVHQRVVQIEDYVEDDPKFVRAELVKIVGSIMPLYHRSSQPASRAQSPVSQGSMTEESWSDKKLENKEVSSVNISSSGIKGTIASGGGQSIGPNTFKKNLSA